MRRMFSEKQIKEMISAGAQSEIASALEGDIEVDGDLNVGGDLEVTGDIAGAEITGDSIIENMSGYSYELGSAIAGATQEVIYASVVKNGNKITFVVFQDITITADTASNYVRIGTFTIPSSVGANLYPNNIGGSNILEAKMTSLFATGSDTATSLRSNFLKNSDTSVSGYLYGINSITKNTRFSFRYEVTFLLSENMVSSGE